MAGAAIAAAAESRVTAPAAAETRFTGPVPAGKLAAPPKLETSGLAASRRSPGVLWTHDDSGGAAALYAVRTNGERIGVLRIRGEKNEDWEDLAAFALDGKAWLLIADTGDNDATRPTVLLHLVEEPPVEQFERGSEVSIRATRTLRVRYEDGPRDCEAVAVDAAERAVYLLTKRDRIPRLYRVELEPRDGNAIVIGRHVGALSRLPQPTAAQLSLKGYLGRRRGEPTAMDFTADGSAALVLTYGDLLFYPRRAGDSWSDTLSRAPIVLPAHALVQAEAACLSPDGRTIFVAAEGNRTLLRYDRE